jgi:hypothetical protein
LFHFIYPNYISFLRVVFLIFTNIVIIVAPDAIVIVHVPRRIETSLSNAVNGFLGFGGGGGISDTISNPSLQNVVYCGLELQLYGYDINLDSALGYPSTTLVISPIE